MMNATGNDPYSTVLGRLSEVLDRIAPQSNEILTDDQKRLVMAFRSLRNGLGNFGRHGQPFDNALMPSPLVTPTAVGTRLNILTFFEPPLPSRTRQITLHHADRTVTRYDVQYVDDEYWELPIVNLPVVLVEATGPDNSPLVIGRPTNGKKLPHKSHPTTVVGNQRTYESSPYSAELSSSGLSSDASQGE